METLLWLTQDPVSLLERRHKKYGDVFFAELLAPRDWNPASTRFEKKRILFLQSPTLVKALFSEGGDALESGASVFLRPFLGARSIFVLEDGEHDAHRRSIAGALSPDGERHKRITRECAARLLSDLHGEQSVSTFMEDLASEINIRYMFSDISSEEVRSLQGWLREGLDAVSSAMPFLPALMARFGPRSRGSRLHAAITRVRNFVRNHVDARLKEATPACDLISRYLAAASSAKLPRNDMCDDVCTLLVTGYTSTAATMSWTFYYIARDEALRAAVLADCARGAPEGSRLLQACCKEALRLWPPVPVIIRRARRKLRIVDLEVPANTYLIATVIRTHRTPDTFPRPDAFEPQRFLDRQYSPCEYLPFGNGARRCIGQLQAVQEMLTALPLILQRSTVTGVASKPVKRHVMFVPPKSVKIKPRAA